jgi:alpha-N-acetylglucosaminidase
VQRTKSSGCKDLVKGIGFIPEGINNNPVAYDLMAELAWNSDITDVSQWIEGYVKYRYGTSEKKLNEAWQLLLQTAYGSPQVYQEGPSESIF